MRSADLPQGQSIAYNVSLGGKQTRINIFTDGNRIRGTCIKRTSARKVKSKIALKFLGDANLWPQIYRDNTAVLKNGAHMLAAGMKLLIKIPQATNAGVSDPTESSNEKPAEGHHLAVPMGKRTPTDIIIRKSSGEENRSYTGFTYEHPQHGPTEYGYDGAALLNELGFTARLINNATLFDVMLDTVRTLIRVLIDGRYVENDSILLKDLEMIGIKVEYNKAARAVKKQVIIDAYKPINIIILKTNGEVNRDYTGFIDKEISYGNNAVALLKELGCVAPNLPQGSTYYNVSLGGKQKRINVFTDGSTIKGTCIKLGDLRELGMRVTLHNNKNPKEVVIDASYLYDKFTYGDVELHIMQTHADNIYLDTLVEMKGETKERSKTLISSGYYGVNGGFFVMATNTAISLAINNGVSLLDSTGNYMGVDGKTQDGLPYKAGSLIYSGDKTILCTPIGKRGDELRVTLNNCIWAQGGISMNLGNKNWYTIAKNENLPGIDNNTLRTGMVCDTKKNVLLIATHSTCTSGNFRMAIQAYLKITDSDNSPTGYMGIFLDGGSSTQLNCAEKSLITDRPLAQIVRIKNKL